MYTTCLIYLLPNWWSSPAKVVCLHCINYSQKTSLFQGPYRFKGKKRGTKELYHKKPFKVLDEKQGHTNYLLVPLLWQILSQAYNINVDILDSMYIISCHAMPKCFLCRGFN